jgi:hypothetical protein
MVRYSYKTDRYPFCILVNFYLTAYIPYDSISKTQKSGRLIPCRNNVKVMKREVGIAPLSQRVSVGVMRHRKQLMDTMSISLNKASELRTDCIGSMLRLRWECPLQHQSIANRCTCRVLYRKI